MLPQLSQHLRAKWSDLNVERPKPDQLSFLGMRTEVGDGYAIFLAFADHDPEPCLAVKIPRGADSERRLQNEWQMLSYLQAKEGMEASLPRPLLWEVVGDVRALVITAPPGLPMTSSHSSTVERFTRVSEWLVQLAVATRAPQPSVTVEQDLMGMAEQVGATFQLKDREMSVVEDWTVECLGIVRDAQAGLFAVHGNLHHRNLWWANDHLTAVNWERGALVGLPLQDLYAFVTTYHACVPQVTSSGRRSKEDCLRVFRSTCFSDDSHAELVRRVITDYCAALDVPLEGAEACLGLFLVRAALGEYEELLLAAERGFLPFLGGRRTTGQAYGEAIKDRMWINVLRVFIEERAQFKVGKGSAYHAGRASEDGFSVAR
jgi:hypothetical protein